MSAVPDTVCLSPNHWTGLPTSKKHLMQIFAESGRVLYVEPPIDVFSVLGRRRRWGKLRGLRRAPEGPWILSPVAGAIHSRTTWRLRFHERARGRVGRACGVLGIRSPVVWAFAPEHIAYAGELDESLLIYYVTDEPTTLALDRDETNALDRAMAERADVVFALSEGLRAARAGLGDVHRLPSAADKRHFARVLAGDENADIDRFLGALEHPRVVPREFEGVDRPLILFGGAAYGWFFHELLWEVASAHREWLFALVGPRGPALAESRLPPNVLAVGRVPYDELPWYIARADVTFIPIREGGTFENCDPVIVYEYLLCGKPVVATPFPSALEHGPLVRVAATPEDFGRQIGEAIEESRSREAARRRVDYGFTNTWEDRAREARRIILARLESRAEKLQSGGAACPEPPANGAALSNRCRR